MFSSVPELLLSRQNMVQILHGRETPRDGELEKRLEIAGQTSHPVQGERKDLSTEPALPNTGQQVIATATLQKHPSPRAQTSEEDSTKKQRKKKPPRIVDRRRRRRGGGGHEDLSSEESTDNSGSESDGGGRGVLSRSSSDDSFSTLSGSDEEDNVDLLDTLSDSSYTSEEEEEKNTARENPPTKVPSNIPTLSPSAPAVTSSESTPSPRQRPRRNVVIAAKFNTTSLQTSPNAQAKPEVSFQQARTRKGVRKYSELSKSARASNTRDVAAKSGATVPAATNTTSGFDASLQKLLDETEFQSAVHSACSLSAEDSYLMAIKVFADWLQSYPVIIATCGQVLQI